MKSDQIQTAVIVVAAMLLGSGLTYYLLRSPVSITLPSLTIPEPQARSEPFTSIRPPGATPKALAGKPALDDEALEAALAAAKAARTAGKLKPLATTPETLFRGFGAFNYRLFTLSQRHPEPPAEGSPEYAAYKTELDQLTADYANLVSDEALLNRVQDDTPAQRAHLQSHLAAGALDLDDPTTAKVETLLLAAFTAVEPAPGEARELTPEQQAELERKATAAEEELTRQITTLLTPEQRTRLEALGIDIVLEGLPDDDE
jgi:hypothetical protein